VRADYAGSDIERKWGDRRSAPRDYLFRTPGGVGQNEVGPDLSNIGKRAPVEADNAPATATPTPAGPSSAQTSPRGSFPRCTSGEVAAGDSCCGYYIRPSGCLAGFFTDRGRGGNFSRVSLGEPGCGSGCSDHGGQRLAGSLQRSMASRPSL